MRTITSDRRADGKMEGKAEYIGTIERNTQCSKWEFRDLKLIIAWRPRNTCLGRINYEIARSRISFSISLIICLARWSVAGDRFGSHTKRIEISSKFNLQVAHSDKLKLEL